MTPSNNPKVSIIILNWNNIGDTLAVLDDLKQVDYPNFSVLVVDNASSDDSIGQLARRMESQRTATTKQPYRLTLLPLSKNFGYAEGNNKGVAQASRELPDYYLLLNNDTVLSPDFLSKLVVAAENDPKLGALGPTIFFADKNGQKLKELWYAGGWINFLAGGAHHSTELVKEKGIIETEFISGCCLLLRKEAVANLKPLFDPAFFAYNEDVDLCLRLVAKGFALGYVPDAKIWHKLAGSSGGSKSSNFWYYNVRNNFLIMSRYAKWYQWLVFIPYFLFYKPVLWSIVGAIVRPRRDKFWRLLAIAQATFDAARGKYGQRP